MQGAEIKDEGSVLKYMTKSEIDEQRSSLHIMTQRHLCVNLNLINRVFCMVNTNAAYLENFYV